MIEASPPYLWKFGVFANRRGDENPCCSSIDLEGSIGLEGSIDLGGNID